MSQYKNQYEKSHALIIGIDSYHHPAWPPLGNAEQDARDIAGLLTAVPYAFDSVSVLLGVQAIKQAILDALFDLRAADPDDRVIVYFSGHGFTRVDQFGRETGYLACYDAINERDYTALKLDDLLDLRRNCPAKHIAFIFDSCFSGKALGLTKAATTTPELFRQRRAYQVLTAGAADQTVSDFYSMTRYLLPILQNPQEMVTLETLGVRLKQTVSQESGGTQTPQFGQITGSQGGDLVFYDGRAEPLAESESVSAVQPQRVAPSLPVQRPAPASKPVPWAWIGGIGAAVVVGFIGLVALRGGFGPPPAEEPTQEVIAVEEETSEPSAAPAAPGAKSTPDPVRSALAEAGVTRNTDWEPYTQIINGAEMALVPAGCFMMGAEEGDDDEQPVHEICFEEPFWIGAYEVTNSQFAAFLNQAGNQTEGGTAWLDADDEDVRIRQSGDSWAVLDGYQNHPVIEVSWFGAAAYCASLSSRLPTEAEWEYAARGPDNLVYPWGDDFVAGNVVHRSNSGDQANPVGSRPGGASWVGAFDLSGNLWEWVNDRYAETYYGDLPGGAVNPPGPESGEVRVLRGGAWDAYPYNVRAANRLSDTPDFTNDKIGFRCARSYSR